MKSRIVIGFLSILVIGYISIRLLIYFLDGLDYDVSSNKRSPNGNYLLTEVLSTSEGGHAPYGEHLILSRKAVDTPDEGCVIFAGYCKSLSYSWKSDAEITISCSGLDTENVMSSAVKAHGIQVNYE